MKSMTIGLLLLTGVVATPAAAQTAANQPRSPQVVTSNQNDPARQAKRGESEAKKQAGKGADELDMGELMKVFDKIFPAQPAPPPERLALARTTAAGVLPDGTYAAMFDELMSGLADRVLSLTPADFGETKDEDGAEAAQTSLREHLAGDDPHFDERMRITRRVIGEELIKVSALIEPKLRDGLARSIARRFDEAQLRDINAFLATDAGRAFGKQTMQMWMDPDVMRSMFQSFPEILAAMPDAMKRLEAETAHLPKPKKPKEEPGEVEGKADPE